MKRSHNNYETKNLIISGQKGSSQSCRWALLNSTVSAILWKPGLIESFVNFCSSSGVFTLYLVPNVPGVRNAGTESFLFKSK